MNGQKVFIFLLCYYCNCVFSGNFRYISTLARINVAKKDAVHELTIEQGSISNIHRILLDVHDKQPDVEVMNVLSNGIILKSAYRPSTEISIDEIDKDFTLISIRRNATQNTTIKDCIDLRSDICSWYGGPQQFHQYWPVDKATFVNYSYVTKSTDNCGLAERYWLNSDGVFLYVDEDTPLFIDQNTNGNYLCLIADKKLPYDTRQNTFTFNYYIGIGVDARQSHMKAVKYFLRKPIDHPVERMVKYPIWSTWARYKKDINETIVLKFADEILENNFNNSQLEIDDDWEICYGSLEFNRLKFPNIRNLVKVLKDKGFLVTLWIHPFINKGCEPWYSAAKNAGYLVADYTNSTNTQWWNSKPNEAAYIDFTKLAAVKWFNDRLKKLQDFSGIDSYKFDAGETSWSPQSPILNTTSDRHPLAIQTKYIDAVTQFGPSIEVRSGFKNQQNPIFMRMLDKDSIWTFRNGLPTMVTTLLTFNMVGYPFVLPDMIGGNGYDAKPDKELFIRWLQANVFMPSLQFSFVPWDYDDDTIEISQFYTELHEKYTDLIMSRFRLAVDTGEPVNPPLWWIAPNDRTAQMIDDQFLLGEDIIVAPILQQHQITRNIYLPRGKWVDQLSNNIWIGPKWLMDYSAPIFVLPHFKRLSEL